MFQFNVFGILLNTSNFLNFRYAYSPKAVVFSPSSVTKQKEVNVGELSFQWYKFYFQILFVLFFYRLTSELALLHATSSH